jgi:hypothetical protein
MALIVAVSMAQPARRPPGWPAVAPHDPSIGTEMPHGGFKESGYGKDQSLYAIEDYTVVKHVMLKI